MRSRVPSGAGHGSLVRSHLVRLGLAWLVLVAAWPAAADRRWDIDSFARVVSPMRHRLDGRLPLFLWNLPLPRNSELVQWRQDGRLRRAIDVLAERGFVPTVEMGWEWTADGAMAMAHKWDVWIARLITDPGRADGHYHGVRPTAAGKD